MRLETHVLVRDPGALPRSRDGVDVLLSGAAPVPLRNGMKVATDLGARQISGRSTGVDSCPKDLRHKRTASTFSGSFLEKVI
ncbi:hypothetical protein [Actinomadura rugatobispora]|uniref:Uncharacterized protein n=1 Tax=Actinomadura rugatobispora TaxID=1994 RepID=A0ABW0ZS35_9ACTN